MRDAIGERTAQQNADKFRACARAPSASAVPPASGIAPVRVWPTLNVHPPCPVVKTYVMSIRRRLGNRITKPQASARR
jgi:hypothetical protein